jgi:hypothetical protein
LGVADGDEATPVALPTAIVVAELGWLAAASCVGWPGTDSDWEGWKVASSGVVAFAVASAGVFLDDPSDARLWGAGSAVRCFTIRVSHPGSTFKCAAEATVAPQKRSAAVTVSQKVLRRGRAARMWAAMRVSCTSCNGSGARMKRIARPASRSARLD